MGDSFSVRHGISPDRSKAPVLDDAPEKVRVGLLGVLQTQFTLSDDAILEVVCSVLGVFEQGNWGGDFIRNEMLTHIQRAKWYEIYDIIEEFYQYFLSRDQRGVTDGASREYEEAINKLLIRANVGWEMVDGQLQARSDEESQRLFNDAVEALGSAGFSTSTDELREAIRDISRRPEPDITGAIQHAMGALEAVARVVSDEPKMTLGEIIKAHAELFPKPLDDALQKMWGYSSNEGGRHGKEGHELGYEEAFLVVSVVVALCPYLLSKMSGEE